MSDFNPVQLIGNDTQNVINQSQVSIPFSSNDLQNQSNQLLQSAGNSAASEISELSAGVRAVVNQQLPFPAKKLMTFFLLDKNKALVTPTDGGFQPGYLFNLTVNPSNFNITYPAKSVNATRTMGGWALQHWYPEIGAISADGMIGNLLQRYNSDVKKAPNWQNLAKLLKVFQNNGIPYQTGPITRSTAMFNPTAVLVYDRVTYYGYFENFTLTEDESNPYTRRYNFNYKFLDMIETMDIVSRTSQGIGNAVNAGASGLLGNTPSSINNLLNVGA